MSDATALREWLNDFRMQGRNINRLFTQKLEDFEIIEELPVPVKIAGRTFYIGQFTVESEHKFFQEWTAIMSLLCATIAKMDLTTQRKEDLIRKADFSLLAQGAHLAEFLYLEGKIYKILTKLAWRALSLQQHYFRKQNASGHNRKLVKWYNCSLWWFRKNVTKETLIQICFLTYLYNFDSVKKNVSVAIKKMGMEALSETYIAFWLQNLDGLTGKFVKPLQPDIDSVFNDTENDTILPAR